MIRNPRTALIAAAMLAASESAKPAVAIVEDDPVQRRKIEDALQGEVVVVGAGPYSGRFSAGPYSGRFSAADLPTGTDYTEYINHLDHKRKTVRTLRRPDIEAWNRKIDEEKAAKRREKGKS